MLPSGNDAAITLAENLGLLSLDKDKPITFTRIDNEGPIAVEHFISLMNDRTMSLGMCNTEFKDPCGLLNGTSTSLDIELCGE